MAFTQGERMIGLPFPKKLKKSAIAGPMGALAVT
jgi:hypothetical protein